MLNRRSFLQGLVGGTVASSYRGLGTTCLALADSGRGPAIGPPRAGEDVFGFVRRHRGAHDARLFARILGAANAFKEGDEIVGVAAADERSRRHARQLLAATRLADLDARPLHRDSLYAAIAPPRALGSSLLPADSTLGRLKAYLLGEQEDAIKEVMPGLSSDVIACVVKLMSNQELIQVSRQVFNPLPGSQIGARGYLGARVQPNSPTDHVDDIRWQVLDAWSYAVGDVLLGTNPVSSDPASVAAIQRTLRELLETFEVDHLMPHCVLSHIDVQAEVEAARPGSTALWFQSIAGCDEANQTFDISVEKMMRYAARRSGPFGMYFETGQGADFTNGHGHGFDMVLHESRKYGFARALSRRVAAAREAAGFGADAWVHLNDVAGFIGPEVFRAREQLVRCCLEDIVMGKLHGLCIGLDVCSTLHMDVSLDDLDWCLDQIMPANPAYLMALPTKIDPMLGYLTTGYHDHVRLRQKFGYRVNDPMWRFFQQLGVIDANGQPTEHFGDPLWVFLQFRRRLGDGRTDAEILAEGRRELEEVRGRGLFVAEGSGSRPETLPPQLAVDIRRIYDDAKLSIWAEMGPEFIEKVPNSRPITTTSKDRTDYILHPATGEQPSEGSLAFLHQLRQSQEGRCDAQIVVSDGLNALAIMEEGHLEPFLRRMRRELEKHDVRIAAETLVVTAGRVRAGYRIGEVLFADLDGPRGLIHLIGERPGTGHRTFSAYLTAPSGQIWGQPGRVDHNLTKVVSGIAATALDPVEGATEVVRLLRQMMA